MTFVDHCRCCHHYYLVTFTSIVCQNPGVAFRANAAMPGSDNGNPTSGVSPSKWKSSKFPEETLTCHVNGDPSFYLCVWTGQLAVLPWFDCSGKIRGRGEAFHYPCQGLQSPHKTFQFCCVLEIPGWARRTIPVWTLPTTTKSDSLEEKLGIRIFLKKKKSPWNGSEVWPGPQTISLAHSLGSTRELSERVKYWALSPISEDTDLGGLLVTPGLEISKGLKRMIADSQDWDHRVSYEGKKNQRSQPANERMLEFRSRAAEGAAEQLCSSCAFFLALQVWSAPQHGGLEAWCHFKPGSRWAGVKLDVCG